MVVFAAQGDARRSMALLWRGPGSPGAHTGPGPKPALSVDAIVDAAIAVADADGMAGLSMRAVGDRLGCTAMALYTYVPNKSELLDLMYDRAHAELPSAYELGSGWRAAAAGWSGDLLAFYLCHPWVLQVSQARPVLGPNEYVVLETVVRILHGTGLPAVMLRRVVGTLFSFVRGAAQTVAETRQAPTVTGVSDEEWWLARSAMLTELAPDFTERFPAISAMESAGAFAPADDAMPYLEREARETFAAGLTVLLDGVEVAIAKTAS
ncbi:TetR family transcriptional regulator [Solihabitans fulvus]|uniref:TetR family transcriptional regulator n=1 Tax=Solihabitans fulvus TaxID=1892852 RepID=A0A5B2X472_9PSEU|nr:TetR/AcrR family transcriptional regulator C-terminal domain-containing protein [Solihabitans fulvus]KAA2258108.1 TetR family transcriptional regulator [Solihabitans fulvus]